MTGWWSRFARHGFTQNALSPKRGISAPSQREGDGMFIAFLFLMSAAAFAISTVSGGGAGLLLLPVLRMGLAAPQVPVALSVGSSVSSLARLGLFFRHISWPLVLRFVPLSLPGAALGVWLLGHVSPAYLEALLGLFLLGNLPFLLRRGASPSIQAPMVAILGFAAGFVSGLTGAVGLLFNRFYFAYGLDRERVVATRAANEILLHLTKLVLYACFGLLTADAWTAGIIVGAAAVLAALGVRMVLPYLSEIVFRRMGYVAMVMAGVVMTGKAGSSIADQNGIAVTSRRAERGLDLSFAAFGSQAVLELRRGSLPEIEYRIAFDELPPDRRSTAEALIDGAEHVVVEAVRGWGTKGYELYVHRDGEVTKHHL